MTDPLDLDSITDILEKEQEQTPAEETPIGEPKTQQVPDEEQKQEAPQELETEVQEDADGETIEAEVKDAQEGSVEDKEYVDPITKEYKTDKNNRGCHQVWPRKERLIYLPGS